MIHILQSVSNMDRGGIESMLMNYYRHLDRTRFQFDFLVNKKKPGFFDDEIRALGGRIFQSPGVAPQSYPAYLRSMQQLLAQHPEIKVLHAHNEAMQLFALEGAKKAGLPVRIAHAHNTRLPKDAKLPIKWFCKQFIPGAATDYWACGREAGIYYFGQSAWDARGVTLRNAIDLDRFGYRPEVRAKLRAEYGLNDRLCGPPDGAEEPHPPAGHLCGPEKGAAGQLPHFAGTAGRSMGRSAEGCGPQSARPCAGGGTGAGCRVRHPAGDPAPAAAVHQPDRQKERGPCLRSVLLFRFIT